MLPGTKTTLLKVLAFRGLTVQCGKETIIAEMDLILGPAFSGTWNKVDPKSGTGKGMGWWLEDLCHQEL